VGFVGLAVAFTGLIVMSLGAEASVLAVGAFIWLDMATITLARFLCSDHAVYHAEDRRLLVAVIGKCTGLLHRSRPAFESRNFSVRGKPKTPDSAELESFTLHVATLECHSSETCRRDTDSDHDPVRLPAWPYRRDRRHLVKH
jgi:hypothetical protein